MDPTKTIEPENPVITPSVTPPPAVMPTQPAMSDDAGHVETKSNKMVYVLIVLLIVILLGLVGLFFYKQFTSATTSKNEINVPTQTAKATPTIVVPTYTPEEAEANGVSLNDVDSKLDIIEKNVNGL